ncbi:flagellar motor protein MotB [Neobacillus vireti]|uniref:Flagellar motor protein MotB n=1 Tax=Neobacillus vireti LMG 21834 TaxID=1131730 RepID=A0AB94IL35_9BACI|nr:flagellar motor protein MotB [Neobacillus vireti]ETI67713.1 flagellar motor protein MotB [Neobacillus vireti LMG 21834]
MRKPRKHFEEEQDEHMDESWLIPYADIMTLLLALFIVLFAASNINVSKYEAIMNALKSELTGTKIESNQKGLSPKPASKSTAAVPQKQEPVQNAEPKKSKEEIELDNLKEKLQQYIADNGLKAVITLADTKRGVEVTLQDVILFDSGKADLKPNSFQTLDGLVGLINTVPNPISIEGYTDNVPVGKSGFASNWELSSARAVSVLYYFESKSIASNRLQFTGYGESHPLYPNDTNEHRQENRRVTIVILRAK